MYYISGGSDFSWFNKPTSDDAWVLEFSHEKRDYFLNLRIIWKEIEAEMFSFYVDGVEIHLPSGMFVMIGDSYGKIDWIMVDELVSRPADLVCITGEFEQWSVRESICMRSVGVKKFLWPITKNLIPMKSPRGILMLSEKDVYTKTSSLNANDFTI